jgi:sulfide:quinone oxidoreductase
LTVSEILGTQEHALAANTDVQKQFTVVIVGGGTGGISVAARLKRMRPKLEIALIDAARYHYYQPAWTLVGAGVCELEATRRVMSGCIPAGVELISGEVIAFEPERNAVVLEDGRRVCYTYLVVAAGIELDWGAIEGLPQALGRNGVTSIYRYDLAPYTWQCIRLFRGGSALFTQPPMPIKCAGAPQKILYLAADYFRRNAISADIRFCTATQSMFGVPFYAEALDQVMSAYRATPCFGQRLVKVDAETKTAFFESVSGGVAAIDAIKFDMLHVVPPQRAPRFIRESPIADAAGWVDVDKHTLRHTYYTNIFGIGDCTSSPNSKTAAAVKNQAPVVAANLEAALAGCEKMLTYDGYASCPLTTSFGKVMLAEFCYDGIVTPSFPMDPRVPRRIYWWLTEAFLPYLYWNIVLQGRMWPRIHKAREYAKSLLQITP